MSGLRGNLEINDTVTRKVICAVFTRFRDTGSRQRLFCNYDLSIDCLGEHHIGGGACRDGRIFAEWTSIPNPYALRESQYGASTLSTVYICKKGSKKKEHWKSVANLPGLRGNLGKSDTVPRKVICAVFTRFRNTGSKASKDQPQRPFCNYDLSLDCLSEYHLGGGACCDGSIFTEWTSIPNS